MGSAAACHPVCPVPAGIACALLRSRFPFALHSVKPECPAAAALAFHRSSEQSCQQAYQTGDLCKPAFPAKKTAVNVYVLQVRNKQAKMGKSLSKNLNKISSNAERTVRQGRRKGFKLPSLLTGSRTTG